MIQRIEHIKEKIKIALVGKYVRLHDAYLSVVEALKHGGYENDVEVEIKWVDAELVTEYTVKDILSDCQGVIIPGGFGERGIDGMITATQYARENDIPFFGLCLGMQIAVMEFARHVLGFKDASSSEFTYDGECNVIDLMPDQQGNIPMGGTMRLGAYPCKIKKGTILEYAYKVDEIKERHRHRYEFNNRFREEFEKNGMIFSGTSPNGLLIEAIELPFNKFFVGVQYHPEFKSRPNHAHPLFREFIKSALR
jgi:CTP synthase